MSKYIFEPEDLQRIVNMHLDAPLDQRFDRIGETLKAVYGDHIHTGNEWIWSNAGGIMCSMSVLHTSLTEYMVFCGTAVGSEGHVTVRVARDGDEALFEVLDDGGGVEPELLRERLRRPFGSQKPGGYGIGLYECNTFARELGGRLEIESEPEEGEEYASTTTSLRGTRVVDKPPPGSRPSAPQAGAEGD